MNQKLVAMLGVSIIAACGIAAIVTLYDADPTPYASSTAATITKIGPGETFKVTIPSEAGKIAVQVVLPAVPRYDDGAPLVIPAPTFFTPLSGYNVVDNFPSVGMAQVNFLPPGVKDKSGDVSEGENDYGGANTLAALRDVLLYASGTLEDSDGYLIGERTTVPLLTGEVGLYAFSHPGLSATNVLVQYGSSLPNVRWLVGRENPTDGKLSALELGHYDKEKIVTNPLYHYPENYSDDGVILDYSSVRFDSSTDVPYFDLNGDNQPTDGTDFIFGTQIPTMFGKHFYSTELLTALRDNGVFTDATWPTTLATPEFAAEIWPSRTTVGKYAALRTEAPNVHVMLVFGEKDHVQPLVDKPQIHQAYEGFSGAGLWTRLNPDAAYVTVINAKLGAIAPEHPANEQPTDWSDINTWAYPNTGGASTSMALASVSEMADRTHEANWSNDLTAVLNNYVASTPVVNTPASRPSKNR